MNLPCGGKLPLTKLCFKPTLLHFSSDEITGHNQHIPVTDLPPPFFSWLCPLLSFQGLHLLIWGTEVQTWYPASLRAEWKSLSGARPVSYAKLS